MSLPQQSVSHIGLAYHRYGDRPFGIKQADRLHHCYLIGQTGTGKSTLLANLARQDANHGRGLIFVDPHGDTAERLSRSLSVEHVYWDVADEHSPYGYNPLARVPRHLRPLVASGFIDALKKQWANSWGARMEHMLRYAVLALLDLPHADMRDIIRLYLEKDFRREVIARVRDPQVRAFWTVEIAKLNYVRTIDGLPPITNKLGAFLANPVVRNAVCQPSHPLRFRRAMDEGQIIIINLAKGRTGADIANVLGGLLISNVMNAAFSRSGQAETERRPFFLYADEFHNFTTAVFADMLAEARKYALGAILCQQHTAQTDKPILDAILGNVGTLLALRLGATDAPKIARQLGDLDSSFLVSLPNYHGFAQLMIDGRKSAPFSFQTRPPFP
ncbi:DUF87 domain-containing protein [Parasphingopyxis sp.]|uniref:type IV secretory system conjugative DNA transfer family protein n=1 Tax=Parasphingopyxis sp. TaxID=1920299 RepID=UPI0026076304|nr:DUF87 domain-containing protein [Parasphingopyxis sp.]